MQQLGFRSVFAKLFASVMLALILFAVAMVLLTQLVHDKDAGIRSEILATQILGQIDPFLHELNIAVSKDNRLQSRFMLAVVKKVLIFLMNLCRQRWVCMTAKVICLCKPTIAICR